MKWRLPTFWALAWGGGGGLFSNRSDTWLSAQEWVPESCPKPLVRTGVSVARWAAVTALVCKVPVLAGDEPLPEGCKNTRRSYGLPFIKHGLIKRCTSSKSCRRRPSWVSNWRLCSSRIFMRDSSRVLCCRSKRASASMSLSISDVPLPLADAPMSWCGIGVAPSSGDDENENDMDGDCCERRRSYSAWRVAFSSSSSLN